MQSVNFDFILKYVIYINMNYTTFILLSINIFTEMCKTIYF